MESGHLLIESWEEQLQLTPDQVIVQNELSDTLLPIIGKATEYL